MVKPTIRCQGNEWPSPFEGFSLRWRRQKKRKKKAAEMDLAASQAPLVRGTLEPSGSAEALTCERGSRFVARGGGGSPRRLDSTP